ncbi:MAG: hypothetical protein WC365_04260 [Candidatus Babeliales bacterium]|jgi:hypothetical protein
MVQKVTWISHCLFWFSYATGLLAFFEQCLDNGSPIWSTVLGVPFMHHGYYGFIGIFVAYIIMFYPKIKANSEKTKP